ncbi:esterase [Candidimonas sp. SYP-B2681]|uniref:alpha/beta hydrolase n=1 Tax=Candidimonas sp. SYP-B2681 TaxID=2497686 RepID=UPI000F88D6FD|nr:alpha/beta hydrolase-fold protein [Candidimonas sp. SYP-B2681]RTZ45388.1 esterase [Candidimonas sp. SYP-B2681]
MNSNTLSRELKFKIYLPDGYKEASDTYPVIYMLHAGGVDESSWVNEGGIKVTADTLIQRKELRPSVIVMPTLGPVSWYVDGNSEKTETAFIDDVVPYIEGKYRISPDKSNRSIAGMSMGSYGALNLSLSHPEMFCAAGILVPAIYEPFPPSFSTALKAPQFTKDGKFDEAAWTKALYPARMSAYKEAKSIVPMWIEVGDHDRFGVVPAAAKLYSELKSYQPEDVELRVVDGDHDWFVTRESAVHALRYMSRKC